MTINMFTVYDSAAERFLDPFHAPTAQVAIRVFSEAANKDGHQFQKFPGDYTLFHIGEFDPDKGELVPMTPRSLGTALQYQRPSDQLQLLDDKS